MVPLEKAAEAILLGLPLGWGSRQDWLHNLQGPVENENVEPLVQKFMKVQDGDSRILNQERALLSMGPCVGASKTSRGSTSPFACRDAVCNPVF